MDEFSAEYGWLTVQTIAHSYYQLKMLGVAISERHAQDLKVLCDLHRVAANGDKAAYNRFIAGLDKAIVKDAPTARKASDMPPGIGYTKES